MWSSDSRAFFLHLISEYTALLIAHVILVATSLDIRVHFSGAVPTPYAVLSFLTLRLRTALFFPQVYERSPFHMTFYMLCFLRFFRSRFPGTFSCVTQVAVPSSCLANTSRRIIPLSLQRTYKLSPAGSPVHFHMFNFSRQLKRVEH